MRSDTTDTTVENQHWLLTYSNYDPADEGRREAIFALGNGMFVTRAASFDARADNVHYPGTYRAGCYNRTFSEIGGECEENVSLVNLPNWLPLNFRIENGAWFSLDKADLHNYRHILDLKSGISHRQFIFNDGSGRRTRVHEVRLVSMANPHLAALRLTLEPLNWSGRIEFRSELDGRVVNDNVRRYADYEKRHLDVLECRAASQDQLWLAARTRESHIGVVQGVRTRVYASGVAGEKGEKREKREKQDYRIERDQAHIAEQFSVEVVAERALSVEKTAVLFTSRDPGVDHPQQAAELELGGAPGFDELRAAHQQAWADLWRATAVDVENPEALLALRFHIFHILQTVSPHTAQLDAGVPARGWHGEAYRGHIFWDDMFVFPLLNFRMPQLARSLLLYRYERLCEARAAARKEDHHGAMYPWRSGPDGWEATPEHQKNLLSGHWMPDPTRLQRHIGSAVAYNVWQYYVTTGDTDFLSRYGAEMILEIARFWASIANYSAETERYEIKGVIGPDEYHNSYPDRDEPGLDNNAYTNIMAVWTLCRALEVLEQLPAHRRQELSERLGLNAEEFRLWDRISRNMCIVFHDDGIISQFEGFDKLREFSKKDLPPSLADKRVDWALEAIGETADAYQVTKQADTLTLFYLFSQDEISALFARLGYQLDCESVRRTADYYLSRTTHRSSLSFITYAGALAQVAPETSWKLYQNSLGTDRHILKGESVAEGIHLGAMGGTLDVLQRCYLGVRPCAEGLHLDPALPPQLGHVRLSLNFRGNHITVESGKEHVTLHSDLNNSDHIQIFHTHGTDWLKPGGEVCVPIASGMDECRLSRATR